MVLLGTALAMDLLLEVDFDGEKHILTAYDLQEGETTGLATDGLWLEVVPSLTEGGEVTVSMTLSQVRHNPRRGRYRLKLLSSPTVVVPLGERGAVGVAGGGLEWQVAVTVVQEGELPEPADALGDLNIGLVAFEEPGDWSLHDPSNECIVWEQRLVCTQVDKGIRVEIRGLVPYRRGLETELWAYAASSSDVIHGDPPDGNYAFDVHYAVLHEAH